MALSVDRTKAAGAAVVVIAAAVTTYIAIFGFAEPVRHGQYLSEQTALRLMLRPKIVQEIVSDAAPEGLKLIPAMPRLNSMMSPAQRMDWLHYLPHEMTLLVEQSTTGDLEALLFVNDDDAGPDFAEIIADARVLADRAPFTWRPPALVRDSDQFLVCRGSLDTADIAWTAPELARLGGPFSLQKADGRLLMDFAVDNEGAILQEIHAGLYAFQGPLLGDGDADAAVGRLCDSVAACTLQADLADDETILITLDARLNGGAVDPGELQIIVGAIESFLAERTGLGFAGRFELAGGELRAEYRITGVASRLQREFGRGI